MSKLQMQASGKELAALAIGKPVAGLAVRHPCAFQVAGAFLLDQRRRRVTAARLAARRCRCLSNAVQTDPQER